ncbi:transcriptional regulator [Streptosporangium sp. NBC_01756]|uniref:transcriptional regulator n=1 Tax=Streptosporangium sp. NBC_01756 TaxID=2975950 RepID=UPI002DD9109A|nr:transcriptional regulator [Streptosporangium sp. NBC_01756]WSC90359.1 transcriptional regulator [Streptosporangium sp. NBC_01756]
MPSLPHSTSADLLVLHSLRCIGFAGLARVSEATGLPAPDVESELIDLAVAGLVTHVSGDFGGWGLTEAGRAADSERISAELDTAGTRTAVAEAYDDFLVLNPELLDLCTAWQMRSVDGVALPNDHSDPAYDSRVLDLLTDFHRRADVVCADLFAAMLRFQRYQTRLAYALTRVRSGASDYVTDNLEAYHTVWFQLHEDLLVTLGIPRH